MSNAGPPMIDLPAKILVCVCACVCESSSNPLQEIKKTEANLVNLAVELS